MDKNNVPKGWGGIVSPFEAMKQFEKPKPFTIAPSKSWQERERERVLEFTKERRLKEEYEARVKEQKEAQRKYWEEKNKKRREAEAVQHKRWEEDQARLDAKKKEDSKKRSETYKKERQKLADRLGIPRIYVDTDLRIRLLQTLTDMTGSGLGDATEINAQSQLGKIDMSEANVYQAEAHKKILEYQNQRDLLKEAQNSLQFDLTEGGQPAISDRNAELSKRWNDYQTTINALDKQMQDPVLKGLDDAYKVLYMEDKHNFFQRGWDYLRSAANFAVTGDGNYYNSRLLQQYDDTHKNDIGDLHNVMSGRDEADRVIKTEKEKQEKYREDYEYALKMNDLYKKTFRVTEAYKLLKQDYQNDGINSVGYWLYVMPGMIGSSNSSLELVKGNLIQAAGVVGGAIAAPATGGASLAIGTNIGTAASIPFLIKGGLDENYAEIDERRTENIKSQLKDTLVSSKNAYTDALNDLKKQSIAYWKKLGRSDEWINERFNGDPETSETNIIKDLQAGISTSNDPRVIEAMIESTAGLKAQFQADNIRTLGESSVLIPLQFARGTKFIGGERLKNAAEVGIKKGMSKIGVDKAKHTVVADAEGRVTASIAGEVTEKVTDAIRERTLRRAAKRGYKAGETVGESMGLGYFGSKVTGAAGAAANSTLYVARNVLPKTAQQAVNSVEIALAKKYNALHELIKSSGNWYIAGKYGLHIAKNGIVGAVSEGAEEAAQYLNSKTDFASKYGWNGGGLENLIVNDILQGGRIAQAMLAKVGIGDSPLVNDMEFWSNYQGGVALGAGHPVIMQIPGAIKGTVQQIKANEALKSSNMFNREAMKNSRSYYAEVARQASYGRGQAAIQSLKDILQTDERSDNPMFTAEERADMIKRASEVVTLANRGDIKNHLLKMGITNGSDKYATAIADIQTLFESRRANQEQSDETNSGLSAIYDSKEFQDALDNSAARAVVDSLENARRVSELRIKAADEAERVERETAKKNNVDTNTAEFAEHIEQIRNEAKERTSENIKATVRKNTFEITRTANRVRALIGLKAQDNTIEDFFEMLESKFGLKVQRPDAKRITQSIDAQLKQAKQALKKYYPEFNTEVSDGDLLKQLDLLGDIVGINTEEAVRLETNAAILAADGSILDQRMMDFTNPVNDSYSRRIDKIIEVEDLNAKINWMLNDIFNGDAVTKFEEDLQKERAEDILNKIKESQEKKKESSNKPADEKPATTPTKSPQPGTKQSNLARNKAEYEKKKRVARIAYKRRKRQYKNSKNGRAGAFMIPGLDDLIVNAGNKFIEMAQIGTYKFEQFVQDMRETFDGENIDHIIPQLKQLYMKHRIAAEIKSPETVENYSTQEEVREFLANTMRSRYIVPTASNNPTFAFVQRAFQNMHAAKILELCNFCDVFARNEDGDVTIYTNYAGLRDDAAIQSNTRDLTLANTSDLSFRTAITQLVKDIPDFPTELYVKYRNVTGVEGAVARAIAQANISENQYIAYGESLRDAVISIMVDNNDVSDFDLWETDEARQEFLDYMTTFKDRWELAGYELLSVGDNIYGTANGRNISTQADLVFINKNGEVILYDVVTGYADFKTGLDKKPTQSAKYTRRQQSQEYLNLAEDIINSTFGLPIVSEAILGFRNDPWKHLLKVEGEFTLEPQHKIDSYTDEKDVSQYVQNVKNLVEKINQQIGIYNNLVGDLKPYESVQTVQEVTPVEYTTEREYLDYIGQLTQQYQDVLDSVRAIQSKIEQYRTEETLIFAPVLDESFLEDYSTVEALENDLREKVLNLDELLLAVENAPATKKIERDMVRELYSAVFESQKALDELLYRGIPAERLEGAINIIADAMEKLANNKTNFGAMSWFVQKWWLDDFANAYAPYGGFLNTVIAWQKVLSERGFDDILDSHPALAMWYSNLINTYYSKLVDNFEKYIKNNDSSLDDVQKRTANDWIGYAKTLIDDFNGQWGLLPDGEYGEPAKDEVEAANRISTVWNNLYGKDSSHTFSLDQMSDANSAYFYFSQFPDFLEKTTVTISLDANGEPRAYVEYNGDYVTEEGKIVKTDKPQRRFQWMTFITDASKWPEKDRSRIKRMNRGNRKFIAKIKAILRALDKPENKNLKLDFTLSTNKGEIRYDKSGKSHHVNEFLFADSANNINLYTVKLGADDHIGILRTIIDKSTGYHRYDVVGGPRLTMPLMDRFDSDFTKQNIQIASGMLVYFYNYGDGRRIGVPIRSTAINKNDAVKLANLLEQLSLGIKYTPEGYDIQALIQQRLYFDDGTVHRSAFNDITNLVSIQARGKVTIGSKQYDLATEKNALVARIATMGNIVDGNRLSDNMNDSSDPVMSSVIQQFASTDVDSITLPNGLIINREDITHEEPNQLGSTWLGYFMRNGIFATGATGKSYRQLNIDNVRAVDTTVQNTPEQVVEQRQHAVTRGRRIDLDRLRRRAGSGLHMQVSEEELVHRSEEEINSFRQKAIDFFDSVFGSHSDLDLNSVAGKYIELESHTPNVVGLCADNLIKLSMYAPESTIYHEAFHKLMELILSENERDSFYTLYRERYGKTLTDRQVAEGLTDIFTSWVENKESVIKARSYRKIIPFFKKVLFHLGLLHKLGIPGYRKIMSLNRGFVKGNFKNRTIPQYRRDRFKELFGEGLYYEVENAKTHVKASFDYLYDSSDLQAMVESLAFYILDSYNAEDVDFTPDAVKEINDTTLNRISKATINKLCGRDENGNDLPNEDVYDDALAYREIFKTDTRKVWVTMKVPVRKLVGKDKDGKPKYINTTESKNVLVDETYYPNFAAIQDRVTQHISYILQVGEGRLKLADEEYDEDEKVQRQNIDKFDKASQEFNKLDGVTARVKLFFATIPYLEPDGDYDYSRNAFYSPTYMPLEEVYSIITNELCDVRTFEELKTALEKKGASDPMYKYVSDKFNRLYDSIYTKDENGYITHVNYSKEALAILILGAIRSQKMGFYIAKSTQQRIGKSVEIMESSTERDSKLLSSQWTQILQSGQVAILSRTRDGDGNYQFAQGVEPTVFEGVVSFFKTLTQKLGERSADFEIDGVVYNKNTTEGLKEIKQDIVYNLNKIGILINDRVLDYMLLHNNKYNSLEADGLYRWLTDPDDRWSIEAFYRLLENFTYGNKPNQKAIDEGYTKNGFVKELANWVGKYSRVTTEQSAYALGGKKLYSITQNDSLSEIISNLNTNNKTNNTVKTLTRFGFNLRNIRGVRQGSIALKALMSGNLHLEQKVYIGLKTDNPGDLGHDYSDSPTVDDYIAKLTMLQQGYMILPTLADKSTWKFLAGLNIPGIEFVRTSTDGSLIIKNIPKIRFVGNEPYIVPADNVLNQFIEYAYCERQAIQECMEDLGYKDIPGYEIQDRPKLREEDKIKNYHTTHKQEDAKGNTFTVEPNGTRFWSLTEIVVFENGKEVTYNLNDPNKSSKELLKLANEKFFDKSAEDQRDIIARTLAIQNKLEVQTALDLGLIQKKNNPITNPNDGSSITFAKDGLSNLDNVNLNEDQIRTLTEEFMKQIPGWATYKNSTKRIGNSNKFGNQLYEERKALCRSLAIAAILGDVTNRSIISSQESLRLFIGHPAQFKVLYDKENGKVADSTFDLQKRIGGLVSTGEDNVLDIPDMPTEYTCAELNDYEVGSSAKIMDRLNDLFIQSAVRERYALYLEEIGDPEAWEKPYKMSVDEIKETTKDSSFASILKETEDKAKTFGDTYKSKINVADGAAYITADMCKNMLRMRGAFNDDVKKAFDILTSDETKYTWMEKQDAYKIIYDAVNIVTTKYTAYGFREHITNEDLVSDVAVAYYNKFALFPLFPSIATGKMLNIYDKMQNESVDMLLMTSAVKLGSQGAVSYENGTIDKPFNKYIQQFSYLRRQLNTDPEEGDRIAAGTQMIKIALQNLRLGRSYTSQTGETMSGEELLMGFMEAIEQLSLIGESKLDQKFMTDGVVDEEKLSKYLTEELNSRNASAATIDALLIVTDPDGRKHMKSPISATPDATWIESILISTINKAIIDIQTPGSSFVQRSVFAMEGSSTKGGSIQSDANMHPEINGGNRLEMINDKGSMDAVISIDYFYKMFPFLKKMSPQKARQWLIEQKIIGPDAEAGTVAYRIPTQAQSSIHALRFVDVVFGTKDTIILPEEFTKITGSDKHINVRTLKNSFNCWEPLTFRRGQSAAKTLLYYVCRVRFNDYRKHIYKEILLKRSKLSTLGWKWGACDKR